MQIGIIGAGFIGRAVAKLGMAAGHRVMLSNSRGPQSLTDLARDIGCAAGTIAQAAEFGDVVVIAIPFKNCFSLPPDMLAGKLVLDANNYYPERDGNIAELDARRTTTSEMLARHFPRSRIVKAFNAILADDLEKDGSPAGSPSRRALPIAGDDTAAKQIVAKLLDQFGYDVVDAGALADSWRFERAKPAYCQPFDRAGMIDALARARRDVELPHGSWRH